MNKNTISKALRDGKLLYTLDYLRFHFQKWKNRKPNKAFIRENPDIILPPDYLMYESFQLDYQKYYLDSRETAAWIYGLLSKHGLKSPANILDWGCGPGRIIRHMPDLVPKGIKCYGTDYNSNSIAWCTQNLPGIHFHRNQLEPPLGSSLPGMDSIWGISIFTHLSEEMHLAWARELQRALNPGGILLLTTQGNAFRVKLLDKERSKYDRDELVVRGDVKEGHRTYSSFQPPNYFLKLFGDLKVLEHIERGNDPARPQQDVWVFEKRGNQ